jgi:hypothetical protein
LEEWFERLLTADTGSWPAPDVDYDLYAEGEALLGWLNLTIRIESPEPFDGNRFLADLATRVQDALAVDRLEVAHFKMTLMPDADVGDLGVLNLVASDGVHEQPHRLQDDLASGELIVNLRAEGNPEVLRTVVTSAVTDVAGAAGVSSTIVHLEHFRPGRPTPTHRVVTI